MLFGECFGTEAVYCCWAGVVNFHLKLVLAVMAWCGVPSLVEALRTCLWEEKSSAAMVTRVGYHHGTRVLTTA